VRASPDFALPTAPVSVYFDIEGLPEQEFYYLIGALVVQDGKETHHAFWADSPAEQQSIFLQFSRLVAVQAVPLWPLRLRRAQGHPERTG
jgi:predicted RecB family nuclease